MDYVRVTRADVAARAGVSETIVSYVVNNNRYVDKEKRRRVEDAIRELNYRPNNIARALKGKNSNHIIFIADQISNEHFNQIISEMDEYAYHYGYLISLCANRNTQEFVSQVISRQYDGIVISSISIPEEYVQRFIDARIPMVLFMNRDFPGIQSGPLVGRVDTGLYSGARECVRHLIARGRHRILYLDRFSSRGYFSNMDDLRYRGFVEEMQAGGLEVSPRNVITGCSCEEDVVRAVKERISGGFPADAIFGRNDRLACLGMAAVAELGLSIPEDVAVIGFDNSSLSKYMKPKLTTMDMPRKEIGKAAVEMLHQMILGEQPQDVTLATTLIQREST